MAAVEIVLLVCGIICIVASFIFDFGEEKQEGEAITTDLTPEQKDKIREQISNLIDEELENLDERTEASLDKISNTKILELNDYAENILGQINRNHNETVFLYDMLNEKAKEVKNTVKDVNLARHEVELMQHQLKDYSDEFASTDELLVDSESTQDAIDQNTQDNRSEVKDAAKERLAELVRKSNEKSKNTNAVKKNQAKQLDQIVSGDDSEENKEQNADHEEEQKPVRKTTRRTTAKKVTADTTENKEKKTPRKTTARKTTSKKEMENSDVQEIPEEAANMNIQFEKGANNNDKILKLFSMGVSNKDIAKQLNLGVGEVKLVIDLYKGGK
ncbi:MAG: DUF6115 domain-containing protein [Lachnospira sp.]|nr:DUF6115 domain-containing protein [Lachnospira sp.]